VRNLGWRGRGFGGLRGEESTLAGQNGDEDFVVAGDFVHCAGELVVQIAIEGVEFVGDVEGYDGEFAFVVDEDAWFGHDGSVLDV